MEKKEDLDVFIHKRFGFASEEFREAATQSHYATSDGRVFRRDENGAFRPADSGLIYPRPNGPVLIF